MALCLIGPRLLAALALEHPHRAATEWIKHRSNLGGLRAAMVAGPDWIGIVAGKYFVLELVTHCKVCSLGTPDKLQSEQSFLGVQ